MKTLTAVSLLALSATVMAQSPGKDDKAQTSTKQDAEDARTRKQLEEARERLDKAAREVAELSGKLGAHIRQDIRVFEDGPRRAVLGIQIGDDPAKQGVRVLSVSPGGPAADAGLRDKDIIIALDGETLPATDADRALVERMRKVQPDQKVKVRVLRDGKKQEFVVVARPMAFENRIFEARLPEMGAMRGFDGIGVGPGPGGPAGPGGLVAQHFRTFWPGEFEGLELASITPKLGAYFGVNEGVLVVSAPKDGAFKLEDGDVLQAIDGRKPDNGPHALRILRSYRSGEKLTLTVLRQRKPVTLSATMPERPELGDGPWDSPAPPGMMPPPPTPPEPGVPGKPSPLRVPPPPGGPGTLE